MTPRAGRLGGGSARVVPADLARCGDDALDVALRYVREAPEGESAAAGIFGDREVAGADGSAAARGQSPGHGAHGRAGEGGAQGVIRRAIPGHPASGLQPPAPGAR